MHDLAIRSRKEELLDATDLIKADLFQNLKELETINKLLGGHKATLVGLKRLMVDKSKTYKIVDFACGGGDTLRVVSTWANKNNYKVNLMGFDLLPDAIEFAKENSKGFDIEWRIGDFSKIKIDKCDISICSLVCHHFYDDFLNSFLLKMKETSKVGVLINDLHRNIIAYYGIAILTTIFSKSHLVKNDAKLSVLKGFKINEWKIILKKLELSNFSIEWIWAFRHLIIIQ